MARPLSSVTNRSTAINFSLPLDLLAHMDELAARQGVSRSEFLRKLIEQALELDALDLELAEDARRRMADADDEVVPYEQARAELGL
jgi:predicted DNA-binding protein